MKSCRRDFFAPQAVFEAIGNTFPLDHTAILIYDPASNTYSPWASKGMDSTSLRRLRLPEDLLLHGRRPPRAGIRAIEGGERSALTPFLSTRLMGMASKFLLWTFVNGDVTVAGFLACVVESASGADALLSYGGIDAASASAASVLWDRREARLRRFYAGDRAASAADLSDRIGGEGAQIAGARLDIDALLQAAGVTPSSLDLYHVGSDLEAVLRSLLRHAGWVVKTAAGDILMAFGRRAGLDAGFALRHFYRSLTAVIDLPAVPESEVLVPLTSTELRAALAAPTAETGTPGLP